MHSIFKKYYKRLEKESVIKSLLLGLIVGAGVLLAASFVIWMTLPDLFWVALLLCAATTAAFTPLFYYKKYKPTTKEIARRVDDLGLEERLLTMTELEGDDSYIAQRQREDTIKAMETVSVDLIKIIVSTAVAVSISIVGFLAFLMTTITGLSSAGIVISGRELWYEITSPPPVYYTLTYSVEGEGSIVFADGTVIGNGETHALRVQKGKGTSEIVAKSADEWVFIEWSDRYQYPTRAETNVSKSQTITVYFTEIKGSIGNMNAMDIPDDLPPMDGAQSDKTQPSKNPNSTAGGSYEPTNQIKDNQTYYGDEYDVAYDKIQGELEADGEVLEEQKDIVNGYLGGIKADADESDEEE